MEHCPHGYSEEQVKDDLCARCMRAEIDKLKSTLERIAEMDPKNQNPGIWPARNKARKAIAV